MDIVTNGKRRNRHEYASEHAIAGWPRVGDNQGVKRFSPFVVYTSSRLVLFVLTAVMLGLLGMHGVLLLLVALVVSGLLSYVLLSKQRDAMSVAVVNRAAARASSDEEGRAPGRFASLRNRLEARTTAEDYDDEPADEPAPTKASTESHAETPAKSPEEPAS